MTDQATPPHLPTADTREPWVTPAIETMRAGDAEGGPTPVDNEGFFGSGS